MSTPDHYASPLHAAQTVFDALNTRRWLDAAALMDRADVEAWYADHLQERAGVGEPTLEELLQSDPALTPAIAEDRLRQLRHVTELYTGIGNEFVAISTREQLARLTPADAFAQFLQARDPSWRSDMHLRLLQAERPYSCPEPPSRQRQVLALVREDDTSATVAYRVFWSDQPAEDASSGTHVATLRRSPDGWRLRPAGELVEHDEFTVLAEGAQAVPPS